MKFFIFKTASGKTGVRLEITDSGEFGGIVFFRPVKSLSADEFEEIQKRVAEFLARETYTDLTTTPALPGPLAAIAKADPSGNKLLDVVERMGAAVERDMSPADRENVAGVLKYVRRLLNSGKK